MSTDLARQADNERGLAVADREQAAGALAHVLGTGDLYQLTNEQRVAHYLNLCESLSLNALSRPFQWIEFQESEKSPPVLTLYFKPAGAAQMLRNHHVSVHYTRKEIVGELFVCEAEGQTPDGRKGTATKYVPLTGKYGRLTGRYLANAFMSCETGALRRLALSMFGLSAGPDSDEVARWRAVTVDGSGRVLDHPTPEQKALAGDPRMAQVIGDPTFESVGRLDGAPLAGTTGQQVRPEELQRPRPPDGPPSTFHCDKAKWSRHWAMVVKDSYLDDAEARHRYVEAYTSSWPEAARTSSLSRLLDIVTDVQAQRFVDDTREHLAEKAAAEAADPDGDLDGIDGLTAEQADQEAAVQRGHDAQRLSEDDLDAAFDAATANTLARPRAPTKTQDAHAAAMMMGATPRVAAPAREEDAGPDRRGGPVISADAPDRLDPSRQYSRPELFELYDRWAARMSSLDHNWRPDGVKRLSDAALTAKVRDLIAQTTDLEEYLAGLDDGEADDDDDQAEPVMAF